MAANWPAIQAGIFAGESGGDYNALFGFSNRSGGPFSNARLTDMSVDQALDFANPRGPYGQWVKGKIGRVATPMGAYQVVGKTLRSAKTGLGLTGNERMTPETQDRIGQWILANQGTRAWEGYRGPRNPGSSLPGKVGGDGMVARNFDPQVAAQTNTPTGLAPYTDQTQMAGILADASIPVGIAQYASTPDEKSPLQKMFASLAETPRAPAVRFGPMGDARQSGDDLLKKLQQLRQG